MIKQFLITRPRHDKHTEYLFSFSKAIVSIAKDMKLHMYELIGSEANRENVESALDSNSKMLVFLNGHGNISTVLGHDNKPILDKANIELTSGKIVYSLACDSLVELGKLAIKRGAKSYIGYKNEYMWVGDPSRTGVPDKDKNATPFRKTCHILIYSLLTGIPVGKAIEKTKEEYRKSIRNYGNSKDDPYGDAPAIGFALAWDMLSLDALGDKQAIF